MITKRQTENEKLIQASFHFRRQELDSAVMKTFGANAIDWKTVPAEHEEYDVLARWKGLSFMRDGSRIREGWEREWPERRTQPDWDGLARIQTGNSHCWEWLSVWVASGIRDLSGSCPATGDERDRIERTMQEAKRSAKALPEADWMSGYYPYASRMALRGYMQRNGACGRMLTILFYDDDNKSEIPSMQEWKSFLTEMNRYLGLSGRSAVEKRSPLLYFGI